MVVHSGVNHTTNADDKNHFQAYDASSMSDPERSEDHPPNADGLKAAPSQPHELPAKNISAQNVNAPIAEEPIGQRELTADEQMALYEKDLKDTDWGHQPC